MKHMINEYQLEQVNRQISRIILSDNFYKDKLVAKGINRLLCASDFYELPFSDKLDLRGGYPLGNAIVPHEKIVRIHTSSGTTGKPVVSSYTKQDIIDWANMMERCLRIAGVTESDRVQITPGYGLWTAGMGFQNGIEKLGAMAIPTGPGNTTRQLQIMQDFKSTVIVGTSSYALLLAERIKREKLRRHIYLQKGIIGSECWGEKTRYTIEEAMGISLYDIYGLTEVYGPGIGISCQCSSEIHYWDDYVFVEIIDPVTLKNVPNGIWGEVVITTLKKEGSPLIRYRTHDISRIISGNCVCGSLFPRIDKIVGRTDDMLKLKGVNFYPFQISQIIDGNINCSGEFRIVIDRISGADYMRIEVESDISNRNEIIEEELSLAVKQIVGFKPIVRVVQRGTLPRNEGKTKRIIDKRIL